MALKTRVELSDALRMIAAGDLKEELVDLVLRAANELDNREKDILRMRRSLTKLQGALEDIAQITRIRE